MILKVGQKVRYDNKVEGFISKIINENEFEVDWLDGTVSTECLKDMQQNSLEFIDIESSNFRLDRRTSFRKEDIKMVEDYIKPTNPLNTLHPQVKPEATLADYIKSIEKKYPEEVKRNSVNPKHYDLFPEHGIQVREVLEVLCNKLDAAYPVPSFLVSDYVQAMQYFMRFFEKNGIEDIEKGIWYMNKIIQQLKELEKKGVL